MAWVNEHLRQKTQDRPPRPHPNVRPVTLPIRSSSITRRPRAGGGPWHCPRVKNKDAGVRREPGISGYTLSEPRRSQPLRAPLQIRGGGSGDPDLQGLPDALRAGPDLGVSTTAMATRGRRLIFPRECCRPWGGTSSPAAGKSGLLSGWQPAPGGESFSTGGGAASLPRAKQHPCLSEQVVFGAVF